MVGPIYIGLIIIHDNRNITTMMINNNKTVNRQIWMRVDRTEKLELQCKSTDMSIKSEYIIIILYIELWHKN